MADTSTLLARAEVAHQLPGRMRLRVLAQRGSGRLLADLAARLEAVPGVHRVQANPRTGSLLLAHSGDAEAIRRAARDAGVLEIIPYAGTSPARVKAYQERLKQLPSLPLAAAGLAGLGAVQVARGRLFGSATENFWMAFRIYAVMNRPRIAGLLLLLGLLRMAQGEFLGSAESLFWYAAQANRMAKRQPGGTEPRI